MTESNFSELEARVKTIENSLKENTDTTNRIEELMTTIAEFVTAMNGAVKVLNWFGGLAKPIGFLAAAGAAILGLWTAFKTGFNLK